MESCALAPLRGTPDAVSLKVSLAKCGAERFSRQPRYLHGCHLHFLTQFAGLNALLLKQGNFALIITNTISKTTDLPMQRRTVSAAFSDESADFLPSVSAKNGFQGIPERHMWISYAMLANRRRCSGYPLRGHFSRWKRGVIVSGSLSVLGRVSFKITNLIV